MNPREQLTNSGYEKFRSSVRDRGLPPDYAQFSGEGELYDLTGWDSTQVSDALRNKTRDDIVPSLRAAIETRIQPWITNQNPTVNLPSITVQELSRQTNLSPEKVIRMLSENQLQFRIRGENVCVKIADWPKDKPPAKEMNQSDVSAYGVSPKRITRDSRFQARAPGGGPVVKSGIRTDKLGEKIVKEAMKKRKVIFTPLTPEIPQINEKKNTFDLPTKTNYLQSEELIPAGMIIEELLYKGYLGTGNKVPRGLLNAQQRVESLTGNNFSYGLGIVVADSVSSGDGKVEPMIYINERSYGVSSDQVTSIPELIVFDDQLIMEWMVRNGNLASYTGENNLWIFPGGGGKYMRSELEKCGIIPQNTMEPYARRNWTDGKITCETRLSEDDKNQLSKLGNVDNVIFVDDAVCTGLTAGSVVHVIREFVNFNSLIIATQALATPRKSDSLASLLQEIPNPSAVIAGIFYGGESVRPRLLSTGSIFRGIEEPDRFDAKNYPANLIEVVKRRTLSQK